ncbi:unnamed protein product [Effrenium voratum]|uniref:EF-hand domain-containing protein n=1 Tax=Effrenium voratum TaxID=2562239 RepID=A0AA36ISJ2_9DINO|nr:unnamed protein product [Effrenium voratum]
MELQNKRAERQVIKVGLVLGELELLKTVFEEADVDGSGTMDKEEFCEICKTASVRRALHRMGVPLDQAETLFDIIDAGKKGEVTFAGFIEGVKKVRGVPTNLDMKTMMVAVRNIYKQQVRLEKDSRDLQDSLLDLIQEAQQNGNVIHLPPKEEMDQLLKVRKAFVSQPTTASFSSLQRPADTSPSVPPTVPSPTHSDQEAPKLTFGRKEPAELRTAASPDLEDPQKACPASASTRDSPTAMPWPEIRRQMPNAVQDSDEEEHSPEVRLRKVNARKPTSLEKSLLGSRSPSAVA